MTVPIPCTLFSSCPIMLTVVISMSSSVPRTAASVASLSVEGSAAVTAADVPRIVLATRGSACIFTQRVRSVTRRIREPSQVGASSQDMMLARTRPVHRTPGPGKLQIGKTRGERSAGERLILATYPSPDKFAQSRPRFILPRNRKSDRR